MNKVFTQPEPQQVLRNIDLKLEAGELVSIYGESGSGKSTLLYILATLDRDYQGSLTLLGTDLGALDADSVAAFRNEHIGFVFQFHHLLAEFSVLENICLPAWKRGLSSPGQIRESAMELLAEFDLLSLKARKINQLSGGQQQRVAIARALINEPALIIADEPTGNLDRKNSIRVFETLLNIADTRGTSVLMATHNDELRKNSHRAFEMIDGVLRQ